MHVAKLSVNGNPNVGLYGFVTEKYVLVGPEMKNHAELEEIFQRRVKTLSIAGTSLLGVFLNGNSRCVLVPGIAYDYEIESLEKLGINFKVVDTKYTCFGNNVLVNENFAVISNEYSEQEEREIADALGVPCVRRDLVGVSTVGSIAVMNSRGCLMHHEAGEQELDFVKDNFQVEVEHGSVNLGNPYVKSGIIVSDDGFVIGGMSGGPEIVHADRVFGFIENG